MSKEEAIAILLFLASLAFWGGVLWVGYTVLRGLYNYGAGLYGYPSW